MGQEMGADTDRTMRKQNTEPGSGVSGSLGRKSEDSERRQFSCRPWLLPQSAAEVVRSESHRGLGTAKPER